jgi:hypothetical protein
MGKGKYAIHASNKPILLRFASLLQMQITLSDLPMRASARNPKKALDARCARHSQTKDWTTTLDN